MKVNTLILGAGAAGLFCAAHAGPGALVIDHAKRPGDKIRISGGGRCNFTNLDVTAANFISDNPHFAKSALARYSQWDFIDLVSNAGIAWHEKTLGQLFCAGKSQAIIDLLLSMVDRANADLWLETGIERVERTDTGFRALLTRGRDGVVVEAANLVVATGGKSIPKMGATGLAYQIARDFGVPVTDTRPALVPYTFSDGRFAGISGVALPVTARANRGPTFPEAMLCTHRGLSGPAMLQTSSYWREGEAVTIDLSPGTDLAAALKARKAAAGGKPVGTILADHLPARFADLLAGELGLTDNLADWSDARIDDLAARLHGWQVVPTGTEGYRTAEVTLGGVSTEALSSKTMGATDIHGLYFIGECVDVTGWLGGYNFQWAWSSAHAAGTAIAQS
ncbi:NAD(P)/FAD-dependent oxidoreductase [Loktanella sp. IMCC34160]|uniref:NAD(P)/FAD-dependent oxidoreductase n=1 Tax=Loktanella sp. IMCC34160 TaxID=2510646 RepID=UPI00101D1039|nr:NAD(P)/FAD-dependent oxidoreductase [Loktanella sp. IMCC34160]RYG90855.1 NAD(P)/FAD-dependent oxidoreductase [Loktanella sp. IMCC34160]